MHQRISSLLILFVIIKTIENLTIRTTTKIPTTKTTTKISTTKTTTTTTTTTTSTTTICPYGSGTNGSSCIRK